MLAGLHTQSGHIELQTASSFGFASTHGNRDTAIPAGGTCESDANSYYRIG